ncbi:MAG: LPS export ABC transporter periplasmic protein LptC [Pseudomonadales bacterium]|nr:LPS export ABC transporter periplasmic protein LptC [Pseudomonadales bacterium]MCP5172599.1 LPS export ABC transporter periplasmic protein LptC [Pseudomonadales bacterium]MCP5303515.1 LPS export ABC transporter periplasmic protein LptC [Pseudomonadales bacterium]
MRRLIFTAALLISCGVFLLLWDSPPEKFLSPITTKTPDKLPEADGYMLDTDTKKYNQEGLLNYTLKTSETRYFKRRDRFEMDTPEMVVFDIKNPLRPWQVASRNGEVFQGGEKVLLTGDVYAWQNTNFNARNELRSQQLVLFPDKHVAESKKHVLITTPDGQTAGTGMWANLQQERFKLLKKVKGIHRAKP